MKNTSAKTTSEHEISNDSSPADRKHQILKKRAALLAKPIQQENSTQSVLEVLVFKLAQELYAIETRHIKEAYPLKDFTSLPCTPAFIYGLVNLRRKIIAIIDLKVFFALPDEGSKEQKIIILQDTQKEFAVLSDGIVGIKKIPLGEVQATLPTLTGIRQDFLKGVTTDGIVILDGQKLLASKQFVVDETVEAMH